jgi:hypothetical protein
MKIKLIVALSIALVFSSSMTWAGEEKGVKSTMDDLASIVVLCAADHQSDEFKRAWRAYLDKHEPDRDEVSRLIREVLAGAEGHKSETERSKNWKGEATIIMHESSSARFREAGE